MFDLSGRVAVVTGGGRGLGAHMAATLAAAGASVVLLGRSVDQLTATADRIGAQYPTQVLAIAADVSDAASLETAAAMAVDKLGRSEEHTSELRSLMRISYAVFCLKKKINN